MLVGMYACILLLLLAGLLTAMAKMRAALDEEDIEGFSLWTGVAAIIAFLPGVF